MNREEWLTKLAISLEGLFKQHGATMPLYRVTCGFPSRGALSTKNRKIGQCWSAEASKDGTHELMVSMTIDDPLKVAGVLAHEMVHAAVGIEHGHKKPFKQLATAIGLEGKMTATTEGEAFKRAVSPMIDAIGDYPHAALDSSTKPKQSTRLVKAECPTCGYTIRVTRKWIEAAPPCCPDFGCTSHNQPMQTT